MLSGGGGGELICRRPFREVSWGLVDHYAKRPNTKIGRKFSLTNWAGTLFQKKGLNFTLDCTAIDRPGTPSIDRGGGGGIPPGKGGGGGGMLPEADLVPSASPISSAAL